MSIPMLVATTILSLYKSERQFVLENLVALRRAVALLRQSVKLHRATAREWRNPIYPSIPETTKQPDAPANPSPNHLPQPVPGEMLIHQ
jgi:hypothetical protein